MNTPSFRLPNFEGPLELLLYLVQKEELSIFEIFLYQLTEQLMAQLKTEDDSYLRSEGLTLLSHLLLLKSQRLLPTSSQQTEEGEIESRAALLEQLIEYCRFRDAATLLTEREQKQRGRLPRGMGPSVITPPLGVEEIPLYALGEIFAKLLAQAQVNPPGVIEAETWQIASYIEWWKDSLTKGSKILLETAFSPQKRREEWIILLLALLELMKQAELRVVEEEAMIYIYRP